MSVTVKQKNPGALMKVYERMGRAGKKQIAVGFPKGQAQAYPDGTGVAQVAAQHVYGLGVPQRDFMALARQGIIESTTPILQAIAKAESSGEGKGAEALREAAGMAAVSKIKEAIIDLSDPPNAPSTIEAKGSSNPLIDTGHMKDSVTYVVRGKGGHE